jgi:pimeloyl-ACP methyl ester carboxylesterase
MVPEAPGLPAEPVSLAPLRAPTPRTWIRTMRDVIVPPDRQLRYVGNVGGDRSVVDLDAAHMCMISQPAALAAALDKIAATP